jgi:hypothetical protein
MIQAMMSGMGDEDSKVKFETELGDVKILLDDGTEVAAEVVLRDKDLDLAFIRPKAKLAAAMTGLDLGKGGKADVLDEVVALNRLGSAAGRAYSASIVRIAAVVQRPRLFYVPASSMGESVMGAPVFSTDGKPLGIFVLRSLKGKGGGGGGFAMLGMSPAENFTPIILPCDDIMKAAKQAPPGAEEKDKEKK